MSNDAQTQVASPPPLQLAQVLFQAKNTAVVLGVLYAVAFLLLLPATLLRGGSAVTMGGILILMIAAVAVIHALLNFTYLLVVAFPAVMAAAFALLGVTIWLTAPLVGSFVMALVSMIPFVDLSGSTVLIIEFVSRFGQTLMLVAGALWWAIEKMRSINQGALVVFLFVVGSLGLFTGSRSWSGAMVFLVVWMAIYFRLNDASPGGVQQNIALVFKAVATLAILFGTLRIGGSVEVQQALTPAVVSGVAQGDFDALFEALNRLWTTKVTIQHSGGTGADWKDVVLGIYRWVLAGVATGGIWRPALLKPVLTHPLAARFGNTLRNSAVGRLTWKA